MECPQKKNKGLGSLEAMEYPLGWRLPCHGTCSGETGGSPQLLNFSITRLKCQGCGTSKGLDTLNSLRKALLTEITHLSSAYLVTIQIRCSDENGDDLPGIVYRRLLQHLTDFRVFLSQIFKCHNNTKKMRHYLLFSGKYKGVKLKPKKTQLDLKALYNIIIINYFTEVYNI